MPRQRIKTEEELKQRKYATNAAWDKKNTKGIYLKLVLRTDADILSHLDSLDNVQGYIKSLIRADMARQEKKEEE